MAPVWGCYPGPARDHRGRLRHPAGDPPAGDRARRDPRAARRPARADATARRAGPTGTPGSTDLQIVRAPGDMVARLRESFHRRAEFGRHQRVPMDPAPATPRSSGSSPARCGNSSAATARRTTPRRRRADRATRAAPAARRHRLGRPCARTVAAAWRNVCRWNAPPLSERSSRTHGPRAAVEKQRLARRTNGLRQSPPPLRVSLTSDVTGRTGFPARTGIRGVSWPRHRTAESSDRVPPPPSLAWLASHGPSLSVRIGKPVCGSRAN